MEYISEYWCSNEKKFKLMINFNRLDDAVRFTIYDKSRSTIVTLFRVVTRSGAEVVRFGQDNTYR